MAPKQGSLGCVSQVHVPAVVLAGACVAAAVPGVLVDVLLVERFGTVIVDGDLRSRSGEQVLGLHSVGVVCTLLLVGVVGALVARPGRGVMAARSTVISTLVGGIAALGVGVGAAASTGFRDDTEVYVVVTALSASTFFIVVAVVLARLIGTPHGPPAAGR